MRVHRLCTLIALAAALLLNTGCVFHRHGCRCGLFHRKHAAESCGCGPTCCTHAPDCGCGCGSGMGGVPSGPPLPPPMAPPTISPLPPPMPTPMTPVR
jgi:hypothetical protein